MNFRPEKREEGGRWDKQAHEGNSSLFAFLCQRHTGLLLGQEQKSSRRDLESHLCRTRNPVCARTYTGVTLTPTSYYLPSYHAPVTPASTSAARVPARPRGDKSILRQNDSTGFSFLRSLRPRTAAHKLTHCSLAEAQSASAPPLPLALLSPRGCDVM